MGNTSLAPVKKEFCQYYYVGFTSKELEYILSDPNDKKIQQIKICMILKKQFIQIHHVQF